MKKFIAVFLCVVMMATMIPSFFASAAAVPAAVTAQDDAGTPATGTATGSKDTEGLLATLAGFIELWSGLFKMVLGSEVLTGFGPALKQVLNIFNFGDFFANLGQLWKDIAG